MNKVWILQNLKIFENIPNDGMKIIDELSKMEQYKKNDAIYIGTSELNCVYLLKKGNIKISLSTGAGREFIAEILKPYEIFGDFADDKLSKWMMFDHHSNKYYDDFLNAECAFALNDVDVCKFKKTDFDKILDLYPAVGNKILKLIGLRFRYITTKIASLAYKRLDSRIAETLLYLSDNFTSQSEEDVQTIKIKLTHEEIANLVGASRQRTTMVLDKLKDAGIIDFHKKRIIIKNKKLLEELMR